jgi:phage-related protein
MSAISFIHKNLAVTNLQDTSVVTSDIDGISSSPERNVETVKIARRDGESPISSDYKKRPITLSGRIHADTSTLLRTKLDVIKRDVAGRGTLVVQIDGSTARRYTVEVINFIVNEQVYNLTWVPYTLVMEAMDSPFGEEETSLVLYTIDANSSNISQNSAIDGSAEPNVDMQLMVGTPGTLQAIEIQNITTNTALEIARTFDPNDVIQVKTGQQYVGLNGSPVKFDGNVVRFDTGPNDWRINFRTTDSFILAVEQKIQNSERYVFGTIRLAQSFSLSATTIIAQVDVMLSKLGNPPNARVAIQNDKGLPTPEPNGTDIIGAAVTAPVSESASFVPVTFSTSAELTAGLYWIVVTVGDNTSAGGGDINNGYYWKGSTQGPYAAPNNASRRSGVSTPWVPDTGYDHAFRIFKWQVGDTLSDTSENTITENFDTTTYKDVANTSAAWSGFGGLSIVDNKGANFAQSLSYLTTTRLVAAEVMVQASDLPKSGTISYAMRPNATAPFTTIAKNTWHPFTAADMSNLLNGAMQFQVMLSTFSGNQDNWPFVDWLSMAYKPAAITGGDDQLAQSFMVGVTGYSLGSMDMMLKKLGTISGNVTLEIQADSAGAPSGTPITNGSATIPGSSIPSSFSWVGAVFASAPALTANTKYWIVLKPAASFGSDNFLLWRASGNSLVSGQQYKYKIGAAAWSDSTVTTYDLLYRAKKGSGTGFTVDIDVTYKKRWK